MPAAAGCLTAQRANTVHGPFVGAAVEAVSRVENGRSDALVDAWNIYICIMRCMYIIVMLGGGNSNIFLFSPLFGEDSHFD